MDISISTEYIKLDQLLKFCGVVGNGSDAKFMIQDGEVFLNGAVEYQRGKKIKKGDIVTIGDLIINVC